MNAKQAAVLISIVLWGAGMAMGQTIWEQYPGNPVLEPGGPGEWDSLGRLVGAVVLNGDTYHMWFWGWDNSNNGIGHATSSDGADWMMDPANPVLDHGQPGDWDEYFYVPGMAVIHDGTQYVMWYSAGTADLSTGRGGRATSPDGSFMDEGRGQ